MICEKCGGIIDLDTKLPDVLSEVRARFPHLEIKSASLEYHGLCQRCRTHLES
jgi:Fe2+ or Zn2+ uptake regulation protein